MSTTEENQKNQKNQENATHSSSEPTQAQEDASAQGEQHAHQPPLEEGEKAPLASAQEEIARLHNLWMRGAAELDNVRKRSRKEIEEARQSGKEVLLRTLLPVFDNLERAIQSVPKTTEAEALTKGLIMVIKELEATLHKINISKIPTVGHPFNPVMHEAIQQVETAEHPPGTVIAEVQSGYLQEERLIRAAMVVVAKEKIVQTASPPISEEPKMETPN